MSNSVQITFSWNDGIKTVAEKFMDKTLYQLALEGANYAKNICARRYGYLAASINVQAKDGGTDVEDPNNYRVEEPPDNYAVASFHTISKPESENEVRFGTAVYYAPYVEFGSLTHVIRAVNKKVLADVNKGKIFGTQVTHPGTDAQPFLRPAVEYLVGEALEKIKIDGKVMFREMLNLHTIYNQTNEAFGE